MSLWCRRRTGSLLSQPDQTHLATSRQAPEESDNVSGTSGPVGLQGRRDGDSPCCLRCCPPWCCSCPSSFGAQRPQRSHQGRWEARPRLVRENVSVRTEQTGSQAVSRDLAVPCEVSMTTSTFLKMPRRRRRCRASWDSCITCTAKHSLNNSYRLTTATVPTATYINQVLGPEYSRDFMSEQIVLGSAESINVHPLNYDLTQKSNNHIKHIRQCLVSMVTFQTEPSHPCFPELPAVVHAPRREPQCHRVGPRVLAPAWAEGPGSATQKRITITPTR